MKRKAIAGLIASLATSLTLSVAPLPLQAHDATYRSRISIHRGQKAFYGRVRSVKRGCKKHRFVKVLRDHRDGSSNVVGTTFTNRRGRWRIRSRYRRGYYHAQARKKIIGKYGHTHRCRRATSREIHLRRRN